MMKRKNNTDSL